MSRTKNASSGLRHFTRANRDVEDLAVDRRAQFHFFQCDLGEFKRRFRLLHAGLRRFDFVAMGGGDELFQPRAGGGDLGSERLDFTRLIVRLLLSDGLLLAEGVDPLLGEHRLPKPGRLRTEEGVRFGSFRISGAADQFVERRFRQAQLRLAGRYQLLLTTTVELHQHVAATNVISFGNADFGDAPSGFHVEFHRLGRPFDDARGENPRGRGSGSLSIGSVGWRRAAAIDRRDRHGNRESTSSEGDEFQHGYDSVFTTQMRDQA